MSNINADDVRKVAKLARLELPEEKIATYTTQLERILDYVDHLQAVDTEGVPPTTRAGRLKQPHRLGDTAVRWSKATTWRRALKLGSKPAMGRNLLRRRLWLRTPRRMS
jgi:aspartyl/glutamyl-tRNA(Asn/Gln) amidotransferase C subunit